MARYGLAKPTSSHKLAQGSPFFASLLYRRKASIEIHHRLESFHNFKMQKDAFQKTQTKKVDDSKNPPRCTAAKWSYGTQIKFGTLNCRGISSRQNATKKEELIHIMKQLQLDILFLQETHINTNSCERINGFEFIYSTSVTDEQRKQAELVRSANSANSNRQNRRGARAPPIDMEYGGTGVILSPKAAATLADFEQVDGRIMTITLDMIGPPLHFINAYAPQSGCEIELKRAFYTILEHALAKCPAAHPLFIVGDFNARLHAKMGQHEICIGQHVFGRGFNFLQNSASSQSLENRSLFVEFCIAHDLHIGNSLFQKDALQQVTFREAGARNGPPWPPESFAQLDFVLVPERWKNSLLDVHSRPDFFIDSDHYIVCAVGRVKRKQESRKSRPSFIFSPPTPAEVDAYNQQVAARMSMSGNTDARLFLDSVRVAAEENFRRPPRNRRRRYISDNTWNLILTRQAEHLNGNYIQVKVLTQRIKKEAKKDKKHFLLEQLKDSLPSREQWAGIKSLKKKRPPNFTKLKDKDGNRVGPRGRANAIATYLHDVQWQAEDLPPPVAKEKIILTELPYNTNLISFQELQDALKKAKNNKAAGPDNIPAELLKYLDAGNKQALLSVLNDWWTSETVPAELLHAQVVSIFKKGDTQNVANYRPISLLNTIYKVYAQIVRSRIADVIDPHISKMQFGFRKNRSTVDALYIARRVQDIGEQSGENLVMAMLDWKQAFDKISHSRMMQALERLNIPVKIRNIIASLYSSPSFQVKHENTFSQSKPQNAGIRQGCPLSPFLFILVMTVLFHDIADKHHRVLGACRPEKVNFNEILYADDTLLVSKNTSGMNTLLHAIEDESAYYGLKLNHDKCAVLAMNGRNRIVFKDGSSMKHADETTYLGGVLTRKVNIASEISSRIASAMATWKSLDIFWKEAQCSLKNKILIYNAVIHSKLLYALETVEIPTHLLSKLESFQLKGLRKILGMATTFVNRANTNAEVFRRANMNVTPQGHTPRICSIQESLSLRRMTLAGKILRLDNENPMRVVSFKRNSASPIEVLFRRVGRPRTQWTHSTLDIIWKYIRTDDSDFTNSDAQLQRILYAAQAYDF